MISHLLLTLFCKELVASHDGWTIDPGDALHRYQVVHLDGDEVVVEFMSPVDGWLGVWASSDQIEPSLWIEIEGRSDLLKDNDSVGGTTSSLLVEVESGAALAIGVTRAHVGSGSVELHIVAAPETEATREAARHAKEDLREIEMLKRSGELVEARRRASVLVNALVEIPGGSTSREIGEACWITGVFAYSDLQILDVADRALSFTRRSRERLLPTDHPDLLAAKSNLAVTRSRLGHFEEAKELGEEVLAAWERLLPADHSDLLAAKQNLAVAKKELGDLAGAKALETAVLLARERQLPSDHPDLLAAKLNLAATQSDLGDLIGARRLEEEVLEAYQRLLPPDHPDLLVAKANLASVRSELGDLLGANDLEAEVLSAREKALPPDHPDVLWAKENLASTRRDLGDFAGAQALEEDVVATLGRLLPPDHSDFLRAKGSLALTRKVLGDLRGAQELEEGVLATFERRLPGDHSDVLIAKQNLAATRHLLGDLQGARTLEEEALAALERIVPTDHPEVLATKGNLALTRRKLGDLQGARTLEEEVIAGFERLLPPDYPSLIVASGNLAETCLELGDMEGLRAACDSRLDSQLAVANSLGRLAPRPARSAAIRELHRLESSRFLCQCGDLGAAANLETKLATVLESLRCASVSSEEVMRAARKAPALESALDELERVKREVAAVARGPASNAAPESDEQVTIWRSRLLQLSERRDLLEQGVRSKLLEAGVRSRPPTIPELARVLGKDEALVSYWRYDRFERNAETKARTHTETLLAFVTTSDGALRSIELGPADPLESLVQSWRAAVRQAVSRRARGVALEAPVESEDPRHTGDELRRRVLDPVLALVPEVLTVHLVLDDLLFLIPLDALPMGEGVVGDRFKINCLTTVRPLVDASPARSGASRFLALGSVDYGAEGVKAHDEALLAVATAQLQSRAAGEGGGVPLFARLESTAPEVKSAAEAFRQAFDADPEVLLGSDATKGALFARAPGARYLHIATHGWFVSESDAVSMIDSGRREGARDGLDRALQRTQETLAGFLPETLCGLALAGANRGKDALGQVPGILTAEELATLDLSQCDLAVLSACETNVGIRRAGQGIQSLQTALHAAGARTAITSLWKVDDEATRKLFEVFYTKLWKDKLGPADALWQAKLALREAGHPLRDWAGWVLTGQPD